MSHFVIVSSANQYTTIRKLSQVVTVTNRDDHLLFKVMRPPKEQKSLAAFGKRVAELRRSKGFTQEALAEKVGMTPHSLAFIEQGRRWPRLTTLQKLAKGIGVSTDQLLRGL